MLCQSQKQLREKLRVEVVIAWFNFRFCSANLFFFLPARAFISILYSSHFSQVIGSAGRWQSFLIAEIAFVTLVSMCPVSEDWCSLVSKWNYLSWISLLSEIYEGEHLNCSSLSNSVVILTLKCLRIFSFCKRNVLSFLLFN